MTDRRFARRYRAVLVMEIVVIVLSIIAGIYLIVTGRV